MYMNPLHSAQNIVHARRVVTVLQEHYVTGFGKICIVHISNFSTLVTHKIYLESQIHVNLQGF